MQEMTSRRTALQQLNASEGGPGGIITSTPNPENAGHDAAKNASWQLSPKRKKTKKRLPSGTARGSGNKKKSCSYIEQYEDPDEPTEEENQPSWASGSIDTLLSSKKIGDTTLPDSIPVGGTDSGSDEGVIEATPLPDHSPASLLVAVDCLDVPNLHEGAQERTVIDVDQCIILVPSCTCIAVPLCSLPDLVSACSSVEELQLHRGSTVNWHEDGARKEGVLVAAVPSGICVIFITAILQLIITLICIAQQVSEATD